jgi:DNA-binding NarL/FixJ family response regulator
MESSQRYVLTVGLKDRCESLKALPVKLCSVDTGFQALRQLRLEIPSVLVALWDLPDMPNGSLFRKILGTTASTATVALVEFENTTQEIAARTLGVTIVLDENANDETLCDLLGQLSVRKVAAGT